MMKTLINVFVLLLLLASCTTENKDVSEIRLHGFKQDVSIADHKDKLILISFGYTHCPDICPTTLMHISEAMDGLSDKERTHVAILFISLDPERDGLEKLDSYVKYFHPSIFGVHLDTKDEALFLKAFQVESFKDSDSPDYLINHTSYLYLVDDRAEILDMMSHQTDSANIVKTIRNKLSL